jgi:hypothetical protein
MLDSVQGRKTQWSQDVGFNVNQMEKLIQAATGSSLLIHLTVAEALYDDSDGYDPNSECDP